MCVQLIKLFTTKFPFCRYSMLHRFFFVLQTRTGGTGHYYDCTLVNKSKCQKSGSEWRLSLVSLNVKSIVTHTHVRTHTHAIIHTYIHTHARTHTHMHTHTSTHTHIQTRTHAYTHTHTHIQTQFNKNTPTPTHPRVIQKNLPRTFRACLSPSYELP